MEISSKFKVGDKVIINLQKAGIHQGYVDAVSFEDDTLRYDVTYFTGDDDDKSEVKVTDIKAEFVHTIAE